jgi:non-homologous end joining protein Ku
MASTIWKGPITFGLVSFPVRLQKAARKERIALRYVRGSGPGPETAAETDTVETEEESGGKGQNPVTNGAGETAPAQRAK